MGKFNFLIGLVFLAMASNSHSGENGADIVCKNLKSCSDWAREKTGSSYTLGKWEKRSLKIEKDFNLNEGDADSLFSYILYQNDLTRIKRENGIYEIIPIRDVRDFTFPIMKAEKLTANFDIYAIEFVFSNKMKLKNALGIFKKIVSKNGRVVEATDGLKLYVTDVAYQLLAIQMIASELNK